MPDDKEVLWMKSFNFPLMSPPSFRGGAELKKDLISTDDVSCGASELPFASMGDACSQ